MPPDCLPLKLRPVRRAHNLTEVLLPESIVKKRPKKMDSKLANSISYLELAWEEAETGVIILWVLRPNPYTCLKRPKK